MKVSQPNNKYVNCATCVQGSNTKELFGVGVKGKEGHPECTEAPFKNRPSNTYYLYIYIYINARIR